MTRQKLVLFDIDHTLFNTRLYQSLCYLDIAELSSIADSESFIRFCHDLYSTMRKNDGTFTLEEYILELKRSYPLTLSTQMFYKIFTDKNFIEQAIYDDVEKVLQKLSGHDDITLGIFSAGSLSIQRAKINSLVHLFEEEHIFISEIDKREHIPQLIRKYDGCLIYIIDDLLHVLKAFANSHQDVVTIYIKRPDKKHGQDLPDFVPDHTISTLAGLERIII